MFQNPKERRCLARLNYRLEQGGDGGFVLIALLSGNFNCFYRSVFFWKRKPPLKGCNFGPFFFSSFSFLFSLEVDKQNFFSFSGQMLHGDGCVEVMAKCLIVSLYFVCHLAVPGGCTRMQSTDAIDLPLCRHHWAE